MRPNPIFLAHDTDLARLMTSCDWTVSPLGRPDIWSPPLQTVVSLILHSNAPRFIAWGPQLCMLYNDAYLNILGVKHPASLGQPLADIWPEVWAEVEPLLAKTLAGEPLYFEDMEFTIRRTGVDEKAWFSFSYTPIYDGEKILGIYCELAETTDKVLAKREDATEINRLHQMFEQAPGMIAVLRGPDHVFEIVNSSYLQLVGHRDILGKPVREALPEIAAQGFPDLLNQVYATGIPYIGNAVQVALQRVPGEPLEERITNFVYQPIKDRSGKVTGIFVQATDITEEVKAEQAIRENNDRIRQLANTIPQLAWMADETGSISWYNERWYEYTGTTPAEMEGWGWQSVHHPEVLPLAVEKWRYSLETGEPFEMVFPLKGKDGTYRPFFTLVAPLRNLSGEIVQWFGTNTDVSSLDKAHQDLRRTEEWLAEGLMAGRMVVWEWDLAAGQIRYSENSENVIGCASGSADEGWLNIHPDDSSRVRNAIEKGIENQDRFDELTRWYRPDNGELLWVHTKGWTVTNNEGNPTFIRGIMVDVNERINAEKELKDSNRRKDEFLAMLAHELRNPLAPISSAAELLRMASGDEKRVKQSSEIISRQVKHMTDLVDDLLDVSRVSRGLVELQYDTVDIKTVIASAIEQARPIIEARNHLLSTEVASISTFVRGDRTRLIQVISNLLNNAAKYTPPGGRISLIVGVREHKVTVKVSDSGAGISPSLMPHIFELFTQAERTPDRSQGGLGLGLALVKNITDLHGGNVTVTSAGLGAGSTFEVALPLVTVDGSLLAEPDSQDALNTKQKLQFMVVDDNFDASALLGAILEAHGHKVTITADGNSALAASKNISTDVFILDIGLPDINGYELVKRLKADPAHARSTFIAHSGYGHTDDLITSKEAGFDFHFVKPLNMNDLWKAIK